VSCLIEAQVRDYFQGLPLRSARVEDDSKVSLSGQTEGRLGGIPIRAWKYMWHGVAEATEAAARDAEGGSDADAFAVCVRVDNFSNRESRSYCKITEDRIVEKIREILTGGSEPHRVHFFGDKAEIPGIDNCYAGRLSAIRRLVQRFHRELDDIARLYPHVHHQEFLVFYEARKLEARASSDSKERPPRASAVSRPGRML
jgi:hypothetical protein